MKDLRCFLGIHDYEKYGDPVDAGDVTKKTLDVLQANAKMHGYHEVINFLLIDYTLNHKNPYWRRWYKICLRCGKISEKEVNKKIDEIHKLGLQAYDKQVRQIKRQEKAEQWVKKLNL